MTIIYSIKPYMVGNKYLCEIVKESTVKMLISAANSIVVTIVHRITNTAASKWDAKAM